MGSRVIWPKNMPPKLDSKKTSRDAFFSSSERSDPSGSARCFQYSRARAKSSKPSSAAWATKSPSSRAMDASVRWRRAPAMARAASVPMEPARQACATSGRWRRVRPRRVRRLAPARGTRHRVAIQEAAVLAPSAAQSPSASKTALASVKKDSKRPAKWCNVSIDSPSP